MKKLWVIICVVLAIGCLLPANLVSASSDAVGTTTLGVTLKDYPNYVEVNNNQFTFDIYKNSTGYNEIFNLDGSVAVYNEQLTLEYLQGANWKQRGTPVNIDYIRNGDNVTVTRHYSDAISTTYDVIYLFTPDKPVKITIKIHSGQTDTYRLNWIPSGIVNTDYANLTNAIDFGNIKFDWSDVYKTFGNITQSSMTTVAQGRKATLTFNIGNINANSDITIDPSIVGTIVNSDAIDTGNQRKTFYANGLIWVFYNDTSNTFSWKTTADGSTWSSTTTLITDNNYAKGYYYATYFDGTYISYARYGSGGAIYYRRGTANADGSITWSAVEQTVLASGATDNSHDTCNIVVNTNGYPFISYQDASNYPTVAIDANNDGTWSTASTTNMRTTTMNNPSMVALTGGKVYCAYGSSGALDLFGRLWDSSWGSEEDISNGRAPQNYLAYSMVGVGATVELVFLRNSTSQFRNETRDSVGNWTDVLINSTSGGFYPYLTNLSGDLIMYYQDNPNDKIYYYKRTSGTWDASPTQLVNPANALMSASLMNVFSTQSSGGVYGIAYETNDGSTLRVEFTYSGSMVSVPTLTTSATDNITATTATGHGNITNTGGENPNKRGVCYSSVNNPPTTSDSKVEESGSFSTGAYTESLTGLNSNTTYYLRAYAINSGGTGYGSVDTFTTLIPLPDIPTNITFTQTGTNAGTLSWTKGNNATTTVIRAKESGYPVDISDGYQIYNSTGTSTDITGLNLGTSTYFYSLWSNNATGYSISYGLINAGGVMMVLVGLLILFAILLFAGLRFKAYVVSTFAGLLLVFIGFYIRNNNLVGASGSSLDTAVLVITIGCGALLGIFSAGRLFNREGGTFRERAFGTGREDTYTHNADNQARQYNPRSSNMTERQAAYRANLHYTMNKHRRRA